MAQVIDKIRNMLFGTRPQPTSFVRLFRQFKEVLSDNNRVLELMADASDKLSGDYVFDRHYIETFSKDIIKVVESLVYSLENMAPRKYPRLRESFQLISEAIEADLTGQRLWVSTVFVADYSEINRSQADEVGNKNMNLAILGNTLGIKVPRGYAVTVAAYHAFIANNNLENSIQEGIESWQRGEISLEEVSDRIQKDIQNGKMPRKLQSDLEKCVENLEHKNSRGLAVRSSAVGEDGTLSFAGQYKSFMNVPASDVESAYLHVLASLYSANALAYRAKMQFLEHEALMAVGIQELIPARVSGIIYTHDPVAPEKEVMQVHATWGLGSPVVSGMVDSDRFVLRREPPYLMIDFNVVRKQKQMNPAAGGETVSNIVDELEQTTPCLSHAQLSELAKTAKKIETYYKKPQDIEFAFTENDELIILQARPLSINPKQKIIRCTELSCLPDRYSILLSNCGEIAQKGVAVGPVYKVRSEKDLHSFPTGAVLVAEYASPLYASVLMKATGIITDLGSVAGHLATVARENRLPALFNCGNAMDILENGHEITLDAEEKVVYQGRVPELQYYNLVEEKIEETAEYRLLRRLLRKIEPLNLVDPSEKNFVPEACQTLHDVTRFVHEKAVEALIDYNYQNSHAHESEVGRLTWKIPLDLVLIDIGGGLDADAGRKIRPDQVQSRPMRAMMEGIEHPGAWDNKPMSVDLGSFMSSLTKTMAPEVATPKHMGKNLAVISKEYTNLSLRLGYHFTMIDAYVSEVVNDNYIYFRFFGGVTNDSRRSRRARFLGEVLASLYFRVEIHGDLVVARVKKLDSDRIHSRLVALGLLIGFTRQLDIRMINEERITENIKIFKNIMEECHE